MGKKNWELYFEAVKKQDWGSAKNVLNNIAKEEKTNPQVYLKLGDVCQRAGETANAISAYHLSARILKFQGFNQKALALYKIILRLDARNSDAISRSEELMSEMESQKGAVSASRIFPALTEAPAGGIAGTELPETVQAPISAATPPVSERIETTSHTTLKRPAPEAVRTETQPPVTRETPSSDMEWLETTAQVSSKTPEKLKDVQPAPGPAAPEDAPIINADWLESSMHVSSEESQQGRDKPVILPTAPADETAVNPGGFDPGISEEEGMASVSELLSGMPDEDLNRMLNDLVLPISERQVTSSVPELFSGMSESDYAELLSDLDVKSFPDGGKVIEEGDSGDSMYIIKSGRAKVVAHLLGKEVELAELATGDVFGEVAFLTGRPRTASVVALGPIEVLEVGRVDLEKIIERNPEVLSKLEDFYETRVKDTIKKVIPRQ